MGGDEADRMTGEVSDSDGIVWVELEVESGGGRSSEEERRASLKRAQ